ncbi:MAG: DegV family protein [Truepera sp.]|nr:DegV family protein [Truepera sp.]MBS3968072.1 DegV family protein [Truepera sp.]
MAEPPYWVVTDEACDLCDTMPVEPVMVPLNLFFGSQAYTSRSLTPSAFYHELRTNPHHPTTSQPSPQQFAAIYQRLRSRPIISIHVTGALSGTVASARLGSDLVPKAEVHLLDSKTVSIGQAFQVYVACRAAQLGHSLDIALDWVGKTRRQTRQFITLGTLDYLRRGGRVGKVQALVGSLLSIKPILEIDRELGVFKAISRARGFAQALQAMVAEMLRSVPAGTPLRIALGYGEDPADADALLALIRKHYPIHWLGRAQATPVLAVHSGPQVAGVAFAPHGWPWETVSG